MGRFAIYGCFKFNQISDDHFLWAVSSFLFSELKPCENESSEHGASSVFPSHAPRADNSTPWRSRNNSEEMITNFLCKIPSLHPPKINMEAENHGFQKEPPFLGAHFHRFHVKLQGTCRNFLANKQTEESRLEDQEIQFPFRICFWCFCEWIYN